MFEMSDTGVRTGATTKVCGSDHAIIRSCRPHILWGDLTFFFGCVRTSRHFLGLPVQMTLAVQLRRVVISLVVSIITSVLLYFVSHASSHLTEMIQAPFMSKTKGLNSYEAQIAQQIVKPENITDRLDDVGGLASVKQQIRSQVLLPLQHPRIFFGDVKSLHPPRGVLFYGPPGTGKTMLARAIAAEAGVPFISLTLATLESKFFGESSKLLSATFSLARKMQPCVVFFDEIDGMIRTRSDQDQSCVYGFKTEFLTHMDGMQTKHSDALIVIGCTNCPDKLDPAVRRRLPKQFCIGLPTADELADIMALNLTNTTLSKCDINHIVSKIKTGCTGSDAADVVRTAHTLHMMQYTSSSTFLQRLQEQSTTAEDIERVVGTIQSRHLIEALRSKGMLVEESDIEDDDAEESPPP